MFCLKPFRSNPFPRKRAWSLALVAGALSVPGLAMGQSVERGRDEPRDASGGEASLIERNPIRGSTLLFDQSMSTQTAHLEPSPQQSNVPFYGWWFSLRPRWNFNEKLRVQARFDYYKELTNSQETTTRREDVFDDIWADLIYSTPVAEDGAWKNTRLSLGARSLWPTSKQSQAQGIYVTLGATASIKETIPLRGDGAAWLNSAYVSLGATYMHPFSAATTPTNYGGFSYGRQDLGFHAYESDQIAGDLLVNHKLYGVFESGLQVTPKLGVTLDFIWIDQWHYPPSDGPIAAPTGPVSPSRAGDQRLTQLFWFIAEADYNLIDELTLGLGYYNLTNANAPDGAVRGPFAGGQDNLFWSPGAHVYFDVTANLDKILEDFAPRYRPRARTLARRH